MSDKNKISPSIVYKKAVDNGGKITNAVIEAGLSPAYARSGKFQKTKSWQSFLAKHLPDEYLAKKHRSLLDSGDLSAEKTALDMAYKLHGHYAPVKHLNINLKMSPEQKAKAKDAVRQALNDSK